MVPSDIVDDVSIDAGSINYLSCLCLDLLHPLVCSMETSKGMVKEFWRITDLSPFRRILALMDSSSQANQKCKTILGTCLK